MLARFIVIVLIGLFFNFIYYNQISLSYLFIGGLRDLFSMISLTFTYGIHNFYTIMYIVINSIYYFYLYSSLFYVIKNFIRKFNRHILLLLLIAVFISFLMYLVPNIHKLDFGSTDINETYGISDDIKINISESLFPNNADLGGEWILKNDWGNYYYININKTFNCYNKKYKEHNIEYKLCDSSFSKKENNYKISIMEFENNENAIEVFSIMTKPYKINECSKLSNKINYDEFLEARCVYKPEWHPFFGYKDITGKTIPDNVKIIHIYRENNIIIKIVGETISRGTFYDTTTINMISKKIMDKINEYGNEYENNYYSNLTLNISYNQDYYIDSYDVYYIDSYEILEYKINNKSIIKR